MMKKALITGVTGQDGSFLAEFLLEKGFLWRRPNILRKLMLIVGSILLFTLTLFFWTNHNIIAFNALFQPRIIPILSHVLHSSGVLVHPLAVRRSPTDEP